MFIIKLAPSGSIKMKPFQFRGVPLGQKVTGFCNDLKYFPNISMKVYFNFNS